MLDIKHEIALKTINYQGHEYYYPCLNQALGEVVSKLPYTLRLLLENTLRYREVQECNPVEIFSDWLKNTTSTQEIAISPVRILMHDTTATPAITDIAAIRDTVAEAGHDPRRINTQLPVDVSVDHSLAIESYACPQSAELNLAHELRRNFERYQFLKWASNALDNVTVHPPGTGIMHTINLEQLATVVTTEVRDQRKWVIPDVMLGTDSHTPMINGIGVLGWGVGGLEAETAMFGLPIMLRVPDVVGVKLIGSLSAYAQATDLALIVTKELREIGVTGDFVEFFGHGVSTLSAGDRAVVANMAPEYGATTGFFAVDQQVLDYLKATGRSEEQIKLVETYCKSNSLWFDPDVEPVYSRTITINLSDIGIYVAGPCRPQDQMDFSNAGRALENLQFKPKSSHPLLPKHPVAIAAITSCTNTSDPSLLIAAGLLAKKANALGLKVPVWVKTSLAPGSTAAAAYLERCGLLEDLNALGFHIAGYGCSTCIGNSGPLTDVIREAQHKTECRAVAILSGNRNFPGRVHPDIDLGFIMSPMLVIAFAIAGNASIDMSIEPLQVREDGLPVFLRDILPEKCEIAEYLYKSQCSADYAKEFLQAKKSTAWLELQAPSGPLFPWNPESTVLRRPPFVSASINTQLGHYKAYPLLVVGDDVTTDHISPASAIPQKSIVADYLVKKGENRQDLNVFASRRGNWEVMIRAAFHNKSLINHLAPEIPVANTLHIPSRQILPIYQVASLYQDNSIPVVVIAGERYGMGSSRDWAAKGQRLLGIRAVIANSFERIHRSNLIGMGILPLQLPEDKDQLFLKILAGDTVEINADVSTLTPRCNITVTLHRTNGQQEKLICIAAIETRFEATLLSSGGVMPHILQASMSD